ncbi:MAG: lysylphosphatidylglycerol synthase domain-containing protein [Hyphomicrobium sp.]
MKLQNYILCTVVLFIFTLILLYADIFLVLNAIENAGLLTLGMMALTHTMSITFCGIAWWVLFISKDKRLKFLALWARYLRDSIGNIFGFIPATGEIASARELTFHNVKPSTAAATLLVDITAELIGQLAFTFIGLIILFSVNPKADILTWFLIGFIVAMVAIGLFFKAQKSGLFSFIESLPERLNLKRSWNTFPNQESLHTEIGSIYNDNWRLPASVGLHFLGWISSALEVWVALLILNEPIPFLYAVGLQSLVFAARTTAFFVPWGAGIQEGGYLIIGSLLGLQPHIALALSLMKRAREILMSLPGVLIWQTLESRRAWQRQRKEKF